MNYDNLNPYQRWQLEKYGNILSGSGRPPVEVEDDRLTTAEEKYIYELENPDNE